MKTAGFGFLFSSMLNLKKIRGGVYDRFDGTGSV
jgi:hypothetical protein